MPSVLYYDLASPYAYLAVMRAADVLGDAPRLQPVLVGAIFGALFLKRFVTETNHWMHFDLYAWNGKERPGRPVGAEPGDRSHRGRPLRGSCRCARRCRP